MPTARKKSATKRLIARPAPRKKSSAHKYFSSGAWSVVWTIAPDLYVVHHHKGNKTSTHDNMESALKTMAVHDTLYPVYYNASLNRIS